MSYDKGIYEQVIESSAKLNFSMESSLISWDDLPDLIQKAWIEEARTRFEEQSPEIVEILKQLERDIAEIPED